jgi:hypothetical protein
MEVPMSDLTTTVDTWLAAYGEPDGARRAEMIAQVWAPTGTLADPPFEGTGHAEISGLADTAQQRFPAHQFRRTSGIDSHHGFARYSWEFVGPDGAVAVAGLDLAQVDGDGRLLRVTGFFGELPDRTAE